MFKYNDLTSRMCIFESANHNLSHANQNVDSSETNKMWIVFKQLKLTQNI